MNREKAKEVIDNYKIDFGIPGAFELMSALEVEQVRLQSQIGE